jgi:surface protein
LVKITPTTTGQTFTSIVLNTKHNAAGLSNYVQPILDLTISANCSTLSIGNSTLVTPRIMERCVILRHNCTSYFDLFRNCAKLKIVNIATSLTSTVTTAQNMFSACQSLETVPLFETGSVTNMQSMFNNCYSLTSVPLFNTQSVTLFGANSIGMFNNCYSLKTVPLFNMQSATNTSYMFSQCYSLHTIPTFNTPNVTNVSNMFGTCFSLKEAPAINTSKVTDFSGFLGNCQCLTTVPFYDTTLATNMTQMFFADVSLREIPNLNYNCAGITGNAAYSTLFFNCYSLGKIGSGVPNTGPKFTFSVSGIMLSAAALNALYTSLPTVSGQTLTITTNPGTAGDDPTIATAKGWTVTGS